MLALWTALLGPLGCCAGLPATQGQEPTPPAAGGERITPSVTFYPGPINSVVIEPAQGGPLVVYGPPSRGAGQRESEASWKNVECLLLVHGRRDAVEHARKLTEAAEQVVAPARERYGLEMGDDFWDTFTTTRFHDYGQQSTKVLAEPLRVTRWVKDGDALSCGGVELRALETAGYTRGSVSYLAEIDGKTLAFTGDLIYGDGKIFDLYSFQDAIPEAQIRGYHGYGSRLAGLVEGLRKVAEARPDVIVPARGPVIRDPQRSIARLIERVQAVYRNYLSTNALHWYFKEDRMRTCGERVLGQGAEIELMPYSRHEKTPNWVFENSTSRLLISDTGHAFLLDCGYQRVIDAVRDLIAKGLVKQVDGIFVTHYHDDHTDMVQAASEAFRCPVYATEEYADVLEHPGAYHLPAMTPNPIKDVRPMRDGQTMQWHEFKLTFHFFPGQTWYHGALLAEKGAERPIFFIGDAFAPSGLDDYCVLNRNLLHEDTGYRLCFQKLRALPGDFWLVNEHIPFVFDYSADELNYLESRYRARIKTLGELFPWDDPNYGIDEQWAVFYPYGLEVPAGQTRAVELRITNHSPVRRTFRIAPRASGELEVLDHPRQLTLDPRESGAVRIPIRAAGKPGTALLTAGIRSEGMEFLNWAESLITVE